VTTDQVTSDQVTSKWPVKKMKNNIFEATILNGKFSKWPSDQWPSDLLYPVVIVMKFCIVVVCTPKKVYHQVTKWPVKKMMNNIIEATILNRKFKGEDVLLYVVRIQTFAISYATRLWNDHQQSRRTSLQVCWLNLENPCFWHGQVLQ
jgi:hypothetical protein